MSGKMTDKELAMVLDATATRERYMTSQTAEVDRIRAHIAALTAEREEALREREQFRDDLVRTSEFAHQGGTGSPVTQEGRDAIESIGGLWNKADALRERVRALEAENAELQRECNRHVSRLAAIHQRAQEQGVLEQEMWGAAYSTSLTETLAGKVPRMVEAVARYIVGDDAPAPSEISGLEGEMAGKPTHCDRGDCCRSDHCPCACHERPAPTTAEALTAEQVEADVEGALLGYVRCGQRLKAYISLLERRMGAMGQVIAKYRPVHPHGCWCSTCQEISAALTDAPPVFTLEEAQGVVDGVFNDTTNGREVDPQHDVKWFYRQVSVRLAALRKA